MQPYKRKNTRALYPLISISIILLIWWLINVLGLVNPLFIPKIGDTFSRFFDLLGKGSTYNNLWLTSFRALLGLFLAILVGVPAGLILARKKWLFKFVELPIEFFRSVPASALFPLFILFFGIGDAAKVSVVFYACSLILLINSFYGALPNQEKTDRINMLKTFGANRYQVFMYAVVRDAMPNISAGIRVCLSYSFALVVVTEMFLGANEGLGKMIYDYYLQYRIPEMYASIILLGLTGFIVNQLYIYFERKYIFWSAK
ncbi:MAG: ABC transporter permease [Sphingobacteriales bacterium]|nr:ABC transporter permease [Sphingobacteriales bacterium]